MVREEVLEQKSDQIVGVGAVLDLPRQRQQSIIDATARALPDLAHVPFSPKTQGLLRGRHLPPLKVDSVAIFQRAQGVELPAGDQIDGNPLFANPASSADAV